MMDSREVCVARPPGHLDQLLVPASALHTTLYGLGLGREREMLCYWLGEALPNGTQNRTRAVVLTVGFPQIESDYDHFRLLDGQMGRLTQWCAARGLWVLAQVHTHPTDEPHSEADECWPASHRLGFLSIVIPFFAQFSTVRDPQWRVHELVEQRTWREVDPRERFRIVPDVWLAAAAEVDD